jgi:ATP phosphoribosyltransferase regulatory subunit
MQPLPSMTPKPAIRAEALRLFAAFQVAGAVPVDADILLPAETLLDLYGEDIRARAYVTHDPLAGEMMLRPDFTVPVVQAHMAHGADPARYTYLGEVFRRQDHLGPRAREYLQVGYEVFDGTDTEAADAEVFALFSDLLAPLNLRPATGDVGILMDVVMSLDTSFARQGALLRHVWRPARFRALLDRFAGRVPLPDARLRLLEQLSGSAPDAMIAAAGAHIGLRSPDEIAARARALIADADVPPISAEAMEYMDKLLALSMPLSEAVGPLGEVLEFFGDGSGIQIRFIRRLEHLAERGVDTTRINFSIAHGRNTMEYYDGFVFSFHAADPALPPIATGGRYDALTAFLGQGRSIPAVGGVIRPGLVAQLKGLI